MRLSTIEGDAGYAEWCEMITDEKSPAVYLDGVVQKHCFVADEERGEIVRAKVSEKGRIVADHGTGEVLTEAVFGEVKIEFS